jgi:hypothetical protein
MTGNAEGAENTRRNVRVSGVVSFLQSKYPYFLGFCVVEAGLYYFGGPAGNFGTGLLGLFTIWIYYSWISKK